MNPFVPATDNNFAVRERWRRIKRELPIRMLVFPDRLMASQTDAENFVIEITKERRVIRQRGRRTSVAARRGTKDPAASRDSNRVKCFVASRNICDALR